MAEQSKQSKPRAKAKAAAGKKGGDDELAFGAVFEAALGDLRRAFGGESDGALAATASANALRARRLAVSEARLSKNLGEDHPRVAALRVRREHVEAVGRGLEFERRRLADEKPLRPGEWLATGRVIAEDGSPLAGFQVIVFDDDQGPDDPLGDELTDEAGEFRAEYHRRDFDDKQGRSEKGQEAPSLSVLVFDRSGKLVFQTDGPVLANSSRRDRFEILLTKQRLADGVERRTCAAKTATGQPCKNFARPGSDFCRTHAG